MGVCLPRGNAHMPPLRNRLDIADELCAVQSQLGRTGLALGKLLPNDLGLFDMLGNLYEWCQDRLENEYNPIAEGVIVDQLGAPVPVLQASRTAFGRRLR